MVRFPLGQGTKQDGGFLAHALDGLAHELQRRGYDMTTIKFSIEPQHGSERFASQREDS